MLTPEELATTVSAWQFIDADRTLGYGDGRTVIDGETISVDCEPVLCRSGLHGSERVIDALCYAPGPIVCRVEIGGTIVCGDDKLAGTTRKCLWSLDATAILHEFACRCAERALCVTNVTDERCWLAISTKRAWLRGDASDAELDAAWDAARDAAMAAARVAALAAARDAAWYAARDAAMAAARAAARDAAWDAAWYAARDAAMAAARDAAWYAAWYAARDAARDAASAAARDAERDWHDAELTRMVEEARHADA